MPYKTRYGSHYHETYGCCGATEPCGSAAGLAPCSICCGEPGGSGGPGNSQGPGGTASAGAPNSESSQPTGGIPRDTKPADFTEPRRESCPDDGYTPGVCPKGGWNPARCPNGTDGCPQPSGVRVGDPISDTLPASHARDVSAAGTDLSPKPAPLPDPGVAMDAVGDYVESDTAEGVWDIFTGIAADGTWEYEVVYDSPDFTHADDGRGYGSEQEARDAAVTVLEDWGLI